MPRYIYREPSSLAEAAIRVFRHERTGNTVLSIYWPAGEDIDGPAAVYSFADINQARAMWHQLMRELRRIASECNAELWS